MSIVGSTAIIQFSGGRSSSAVGAKAVVKEKIKVYLTTNFAETFDSPVTGANIRLFPHGVVDSDDIDALIMAVRSSLLTEFPYLEEIEVVQLDTGDNVVAMEIRYTFDDSDESLIWEL